MDRTFIFFFSLYSFLKFCRKGGKEGKFNKFLTFFEFIFEAQELMRNNDINFDDELKEFLKLSGPKRKAAKNIRTNAKNNESEVTRPTVRQKLPRACAGKKNYEC